MDLHGDLVESGVQQEGAIGAGGAGRGDEVGVDHGRPRCEVEQVVGAGAQPDGVGEGVEGVERVEQPDQLGDGVPLRLSPLCPVRPVSPLCLDFPVSPVSSVFLVGAVLSACRDCSALAVFSICSVCGGVVGHVIEDAT